MKKRVDMLKSEDEYYKEGLYEVFLGFGEHDTDAGQLLEIAPGNYMWSFCFRAPTVKPLSYSDKYAETSYILTASFDHPSYPSTMTQVVHHVYVAFHTEELLNEGKGFAAPPDKMLGKDCFTSPIHSKTSMFSCVR